MSGLNINLAKSVAYPIRCEGIDFEDVLQSMPCQLKSFPCKYLELLLSTRRWTRIEVQPLIDKIAAKFLAWKSKLLVKVGRLTLVRSILTSVPIYFHISPEGIALNPPLHLQDFFVSNQCVSISYFHQFRLHGCRCNAIFLEKS